MGKNLTLEEIKDAHRRIVSGELTLRKMAEEFNNMNKDELRKKILEVISDNERKVFLDRLKYNKDMNSSIETNAKIQANIKAYLNGKIAISDAAEECNIDIETFKGKVFKAISEESGLLEKYLQRGNNQRDYSTTNTKVIIINMLRNGLTQSGMAKKTGIPVRTISGWVNKLPEDDELRKMAKKAAYNVLHGIETTQYDIEITRRKLDRYIRENNIQLDEIDTRTKEEIKLEKLHAFLNHVYDLESQLDEKGKIKYTRKQITTILGKGSSAIRRAEKEVGVLEKIVAAQKQNNEIIKNKEN